MGKKSKVNKLARMSDEERARYLQHRADMEEEARRRKRELIARFIKNKLDKEENFNKINTAKINQEWRFILRKIKSKQQVMEVEGIMTTFNFLVERKQRLIKVLTHAIHDSDDQHRRAFQAHSDTLGSFLSVGSQRLHKLQSEYDHQKNNLLENWDKEESELVNSQDKAVFKLKLIIYIQNRDFDYYKNEKDQERATTKNDARLEHEEDLRAICRPKKLEVENYWARLREVYNAFMEEHNPIMLQYQSLREKDEFYQKDLARNELRIQQATQIVSTLHDEWERVTSSMTSKLTRMHAHKEKLSKKYWVMKKDAKVEKVDSVKRLTLMVDVSQNALKRLEEVNEKLRKIVQLSEICRKFEHEQDHHYFQGIDLNDDLENYEHLDKDMMDECKEYRKMDQFMLKVNRIKVQTMCLKAEKVKLTKENLQLKNYIKRYLTDLALKDGKDRPVSMKLQSKLHSIKSSDHIVRPVTCIEGALSNAVMHEKRMKFLDKKSKDNAIKAYPRVNCWMSCQD